jgi:glycosyl transferase family 2
MGVNQSKKTVVVLMPTTRLTDTIGLRERLNWRGSLIVGLNGAAVPCGPESDEKLEVLPVRSGYASARNDLLAAARDRGFDTALFIDDDLVLEPTAVPDILQLHRQYPDDVLGGRVERRVTGLGKLAYRVMPGGLPENDDAPTMLSARFLLLPTYWKGQPLNFASLFDRAGGEDTELTSRISRQGVSMRHVHRLSGFEIYDSTRGQGTAVARRLICNHAVLGLVKFRSHKELAHAQVDPMLARLPSMIYRYVSVLVTLVGEILPGAAVLLAKVAGYAFASRSLLPERLGTEQGVKRIRWNGDRPQAD